MPIFKFIINQRGNKTLIRGGFHYNVSVRNKGGTVLWRCVNKECLATITIRNENEIIREYPHICKGDIVKKEVA